jgi:putative ABC transport system permease protein
MINIRHLIRIFLKDKFFGILNILGLSVGIGISLILLLIVDYDLSYDHHYDNYRNIYRLGAHMELPGVDYKIARSSQDLTEVLRAEYPEIVAVTSLNVSAFCLIEIEGNGKQIKKSFTDATLQTDSLYFRVFNHEFIAGDPGTCLTQINSVVITESKAKKYFGTKNALGKTLIINREPKVITAVIKDLPGNTHLKFSILVSRMEDRGWARENGHHVSEAYWQPSVFTYVLFPENYKPETFVEGFKAVYDKYLKGFGDKIGGKYTPILERLDKIHFHSKLERDAPHGNLVGLLVLLAIGAVILILSIVNYINLVTVKSLSRASEIAMKKVLGSRRSSLAMALLMESVSYAIVALAIAFILVSIIIRTPFFDAVTERDLNPDLWEHPLFLILSLAVALFVGFISGLYPALHISGIPVSKVLKGKFGTSPSAHAFRRILITIQFSLSIFVVMGLLIMHQQINFLKNRETGFDKENVLVVPIYSPESPERISTFKKDVMQYHTILNATTAGLFGDDPGGRMLIESEGMQPREIKVMYVGDDFFQTMRIPFVVGGDFPAGSGDYNSVILNEAAVRFLGWDGDALGKQIQSRDVSRRVIGVAKDFNFMSLLYPIEPLAIIKSNDQSRLYLRIRPGDPQETIQFLSQKWRAYRFVFPFEYFFLDEHFDRHYLPQEKQYHLISVLSWLGIFISLLGVLGLSAFSAVQRTREMAIRRIHGATRKVVTFLLYREVMRLVIVSALLTTPIAYLVLGQWLSNFPNAVHVNMWLFLVVTGVALVLTLLIVLFNGLKICRTSPAEILKSE